MAKDGRTAAELLRAAADLVSIAKTKLNTSRRRCSACSAEHYNNEREAKTFGTINETPGKLRHAALRLEGRE